MVKTTPEALPKQLSKRFKATPQMIAKGLLAGAQRGRTILVRRTPKDRGGARRGWRVQKKYGLRGALTGTVYGIDLVNDAPYAAILEFGARPHKVSVEGFLAIVAWVHRKGIADMTGPLRQVEFSGPVQRGKRRPKPVHGPIRRYYGITFTGRKALAAQVAYLITRKIRKEGQKPTYFVRNSLPMLRRAVADEVQRVVARLARTKNPNVGPKP